MGAIEKFLCRGLEIGSRRIEHGEVEVRLQEAQNAVRFDDGILRRAENLANARHRFGEPSLLSANPPRVIRSSEQKTRTIRFAAAVAFLRHSPGMIAGSAVAGLAVSRADAMSILRDLERGPVQLA